MNLFLTRGCNESCSFCYAGDFFKAGPQAPVEVVLDALVQYAALVESAPALPPWSDELPELAATLFASRAVNLLGGEPTLYPHFERVVSAIHGHGLGAIVFTNGSRPDRIQAVADKLWNVTINGHFAHRAPDLGFPIERVFANLPVRPEDDVLLSLRRIRDAGIRVVRGDAARPSQQSPWNGQVPGKSSEETRGTRRWPISGCPTPEGSCPSTQSPPPMPVPTVR